MVDIIYDIRIIIDFNFIDVESTKLDWIGLDWIGLMVIG